MKYILTIFCAIGVNFEAFAQAGQKSDSVQTGYIAEQKVLGKNFSDRFYPNYVEVHKLSEKAFVAKIDSAEQAFITALDHYRDKLSPAYIKSQQLEIEMYFDKLLVEYPAAHESYTRDRPEGYPIIDHKIQDNLKLFNDPTLLTSTDLMPFIQSFLNYKITKEINKPEYNARYNKRLYAMWNLLPQYFKDAQCKAYQQYRILFDHTTRNGIKHTQELYQLFKKECRDTALTARLEKVYTDARNDLLDHQVRQYKQIGNYGLDIHIFQKESVNAKSKKPVIVFIHGGSWSEGQASWHFQACRKYAGQGWVACSVEYRIYGAQGTLPFEAVKDTRSAIRWLRKHGKALSIDTGRIVATGNSAGGHLVLAAALATNMNEKTDDLKISPVPNVLLVNSGVYDLTDDKTAWIRKDLRDKNLVKEISPNDLVRKNLPPTLLIHSSVDQNVPYASAQKFATLSLAAGNPIELKTLDEGGHFIFDHPKYVSKVFAWRRDFLKNLGYPDSDGE